MDVKSLIEIVKNLHRNRIKTNRSISLRINTKLHDDICISGPIACPEQRGYSRNNPERTDPFHRIETYTDPDNNDGLDPAVLLALCKTNRDLFNLLVNRHRMKDMVKAASDIHTLKEVRR